MEKDSELIGNYNRPSFKKKVEKVRDRVEVIARFLNGITNKLSLIILFLLMLLTTIDVLARNFLNTALIGTFEITGLGVALIVFFSLGATQLKGEHISIDVFTNKLPTKIRGVLGLVMNTILFILLLFTTWQLVLYTKNAMVNNQITADLNLNIYLFTLLGSIGFLFFTISLLVNLFNSLLEVLEK